MTIHFLLSLEKGLPVGSIKSLHLSPATWLYSLAGFRVSFITLSIPYIACTKSQTDWNCIAIKIIFNSCLSPSRNLSTRWCLVGRYVVAKIDKSWNHLPYSRTVISLCFRSRNSCSVSVTTRLFKPKTTVIFLYIYIYTWHTWCH
jgi:hypothetical protein